MTTDRQADLHARVERDFTYHALTDATGPRLQAIRAQARVLAHLIVDLAPECREQSLSLTSMESAVAQANMAIARNDGDLPVLSDVQRGNLDTIIANDNRLSEVSDAGHDI